MTPLTAQLPNRINQVAARQSAAVLGAEAAVAAVAEHVQKFWVPPRRDHLVAGGAGLTPVTKRAVARPNSLNRYRR